MTMVKLAMAELSWLKKHQFPRKNYRGKKNFRMEDSDTTYRCLVFSFVEYEKKKEKEIITFYITDDDNHTPVRLDLFLRFGTAKAFLNKAGGLRNPSTSIVSR